MKRAATLVLVMLAMSASAAVDARQGVPREGQKTQWAPTRNFSSLNARAVFASESRRATSPYAGEQSETAAGEKDWQYAAGNPTRYTDPSGRDLAAMGNAELDPVQRAALQEAIDAKLAQSCVGGDNDPDVCHRRWRSDAYQGESQLEFDDRLTDDFGSIVLGADVSGPGYYDSRVAVRPAIQGFLADTREGRWAARVRMVRDSAAAKAVTAADDAMKEMARNVGRDFNSNYNPVLQAYSAAPGGGHPYSQMAPAAQQQGEVLFGDLAVEGYEVGRDQLVSRAAFTPVQVAIGAASGVAYVGSKKLVALLKKKKKLSPAEQQLLVDAAREARGFVVLKHSSMPSPRTGAESHHAIMSSYMKSKYKDKYVAGQAPGILMATESHNATRAYFNKWVSSWEKQHGVDFSWGQASPSELTGLWSGMLDEARVPGSVRRQYLEQFADYERELLRVK